MDGCMFNVWIGYQKYTLRRIVLWNLMVNRKTIESIALFVQKQSDEPFCVILMGALSTFMLGVLLIKTWFKIGKRWKNTIIQIMKMRFQYFVQIIKRRVVRQSKRKSLSFLLKEKRVSTRKLNLSKKKRKRKKNRRHLKKKNQYHQKRKSPSRLSSNQKALLQLNKNEMQRNLKNRSVLSSINQVLWNLLHKNQRNQLKNPHLHLKNETKRKRVLKKLKFPLILLNLYRIMSKLKETIIKSLQQLKIY